MKKIFRIGLFMMSIFLLIGCATNKKVDIPKVEQIVMVVLTSNKNDKVYEFKSEEISKLVDLINNNTKFTKTESINDQPTNVKDYYILTMHNRDSYTNTTVVYLYKKNLSFYLEQPYQGIWKVKKSAFNSIIDKLK